MKTNKNIRRFSEEQIKSLEILFEAESRPEPRLKQQLAEELGLQPRQVAIWFQNRRARFKTKRIERDYCQLKASYDTLASSFESLKTENKALLGQKQNLKRQLGKPTGRQEGNSSNGELAKGDPEPKETPSCVSERDAVCTREETSIPDLIQGRDGSETSIPDLVQRRDGSETSIPDLVQLRDGSETSSGDWSSFECICFPDDPIGNSQWWEQ